ncbi:type VII secretion target [Actinoplanes sp. URMC 104]|uniref:type VII secretion target n=1 Tax=Actinoplanes sp. URMC 104 TaxID=3423409 RepID=UPI003F19F083
MTSGMHFPAQAVLRHADQVSEASNEVATARGAVGEVTMDSQAYGQLCQFLPTLLSPLFSSAPSVMNDAVDALGETALNLRKVASDMSATDASNARELNAAAGPGLDLPL